MMSIARKTHARDTHARGDPSSPDPSARRLCAFRGLRRRRRLPTLAPAPAEAVALARALAAARDAIGKVVVDLDALRILGEHLGDLPVRVDGRRGEREERAADEVCGHLLVVEEQQREVDVDRLVTNVGAREVGRGREFEHEKLREEAQPAQEGREDQLKPLPSAGDAVRPEEGVKVAVGQGPRHEDDQRRGVEPEEEGEDAGVLLARAHHLAREDVLERRHQHAQQLPHDALGAHVGRRRQ
eukprot:7376585-Prymnesium_polylepis.1